MKRAGVFLVCVGVGAATMVAQACGGDDSTITPPDAATDSSVTSDVGSSDAAPPDAADAGPPCPAPSDPSKSSLCIYVTPEAIAFLASDPDLDGKGLLSVDVHDVALPDYPDGAPVPPLAQQILPGLDAGELDLSMPVPMVRFDGLPSKVYPRAIFVDVRNPKAFGAGWWIGGYDISGGIGATITLLPLTLTPGAGTSITLDLTALRRLHVMLSRSATPVGNAMGPAAVLAMVDQVPKLGSTLWGRAANPCAKVNGTNQADTLGFVIGKGPYYAFSQLDDFGAGGFLPPGSMTSLQVVDGGLENPASSQLNYAANAYVVTQTVDLDLTIPKPDAGSDTVSCP